jgi:hypothetical protein
MIEDKARPGSTVGPDKRYHTVDFITDCRESTLHVAQNKTSRRSAIRFLLLIQPKHFDAFALKHLQSVRKKVTDLGFRRCKCGVGPLKLLA